MFEVITAAIVIVIALMLYKDKREKEQLISTFRDMFTTLADSTRQFHESVAKMQLAHFDDLEKQSTRQLQILEKQAKSFLETIQAQHEVSALTKQEPPKIEKIVENTIEVEEPQDIPLTEESRIPFIAGVTNFKFEGEEQILD